MGTLAPRLHGFNPVHHLHAFNYFAERAIPVALLGRIFMIQGRIINHIDKKLTGGAVDYGRPRHGNGAPTVFDAQRGFIFNRVTRGLLPHIFCKSASLNHESADHPVEDRLIVLPIVHVLHKIGDRYRGLIRIEFQFDIPRRCF